MSSETLASVLIRADAGPSIGSGHVVRSLSMAGCLPGRDVVVTVAMRTPSSEWRRRIASTGHGVMALELPLPSDVPRTEPWSVDEQERDADAVLTALDQPPATVVVDHYGLDVHWERRLREQGSRVVVIDDLANRRHDADVIVDQNWYGRDTADRYRDLVPSDTLQLLGPRYALLQDEYARVRTDRKPARFPPRRVLVSYGGSDPRHETETVLDVLTEERFAHLDVEVVVGSTQRVTSDLESRVRQRPRTQLHVALPTLAHVLGSVDLAFGASGSGTWERVCLGVPAIVSTTGASQSGVTSALAAHGLTTWAGQGGSVPRERYRELLQLALSQPFPVPPPIVDGVGALRVATAALPLSDPRLKVRLATAADLPVHLGDDPGVAPSGRHVLVGPSVWEANQAAFFRELSDPEAFVGVVELEGLAVGRVRARRHGDAVEVTWSLNGLGAGRGWGAEMEARLRAGDWSMAHGRLTLQPQDEGAVFHRTGGNPGLSGSLVAPLETPAHTAEERT